MMNDILADAMALSDYSKRMRREFHSHPEIGFQENHTAELITHELSEMGFRVTTGIAKTGIVGLLDTGKPGPVILLRAEMDALPIIEETNASYASLTPGFMHACGHDGHMAVILTVAHILSQNREKLRGMVKFVFQPAEEGLGGAKMMIDEGVLENPAADYLLAMHLWNEQTIGKIVISPGPLMAGSESFHIRVTGSGGHGALPHQTIDPIIASTHIVTALQSIVSRNVSPLQTAVISVTKIQTGTTHNVIPSSAELMGTIRTFEPEIRQIVLERFRKIIFGIAEAFGVEAEVEITHLTYPVINDVHICQIVSDVVKEMQSKMIIIPNYQTMVSEDISFFMEHIPGCFLLFGSSNSEQGQNYGHHHPKFDFDEDVLPQSAAIIAGSACRLLSQ